MYANVQIWSLIDADGVKLYVSCDLKIANIFCGLQAHLSVHPCYWCDIDSKNMEISGKLRQVCNSSEIL